ncbi:hypothetical protein VKT23_020232 [Stygiomarasmius scandens]|uniref:Uncharacterized protein n=1 Tax=Marasmiellus scandens TaxID=2682957 RepID=A0ABR1IJH8_9AGAR
MSWTQCQKPQEEGEMVIGEDTPDNEVSHTPEIVPEVPPDDQQEEVVVEVDSENELWDYGYVKSDGEGSEDEMGAAEEEDLGPEDGEEPINHDMDVMNMEGYGLL